MNHFTFRFLRIWESFSKDGQQSILKSLLCQAGAESTVVCVLILAINLVWQFELLEIDK